MPRTSESLQLQWLTAATSVGTSMRDELVSCWRDVSNEGGAVGFPVLPVTDKQVGAAVDALVESLDPAVNRLLVATVDHVLAGWLVLAGNSNVVTAHWARVVRVQTTPEHRGTRVGRALMAEVERAGRDEYRLAALHLELRGGTGLEPFYEGCGWREIGRWPMALRLGEGDYRDEVLMHLPLGPRH